MHARIIVLCVVAGLTAAPCAAQPGRLAGHGSVIPHLGKDFLAVAIGSDHKLFLRDDGTIVAQGMNTHGQVWEPPGEFIAIGAGQRYSVAMRPDGTLLAWGNNEHGIVDVPPGEFVSLSAGQWHALAMRADGSVVAWGATLPAPPGPFEKVSAGDQWSVGIRPDGTLEAWGWNMGTEPIPAGNFIDVGANRDFGLALRPDGTLVHWGNDRAGLANIPPGTFRSLGDIQYAGFGAAIRDNGTLAVWGDHAPQIDVPGGYFRTYAAAFNWTIIGIRICYANCDGSTTEPVLTVNDFTCFINEFAQAQSLPPSQQMMHYANCDGSTTEPVLTVNDFTCFINEFASGCPSQ